MTKPTRTKGRLHVSVVALGAALALSVPAGCGSSDSGGEAAGGSGGAGGELPDPATFMRVTTSCAYDCPADPKKPCREATAAYACQNLGDWNAIPHDAACPFWDGTQYPPVTTGKCTASAPSGEAAKYAGPDADHPGTRILPDGRRIRPAGSEWIFAEADLTGGLTTGILAVPGTSLVLTVDSGYGPHAVRAIDVTKIGAGDPVLSYVAFTAPETLNSGIAFSAPDRVWVATDDGVVQALTLDTQTGALARDDAHSLALPPWTAANGKAAPWYLSGVAVSPDGKRLVATPVDEKRLLVYDVDPQSAAPGQKLGELDLGGNETFGAFFDPNDASGHFVYVSMWSGKSVAEVDLTDPTAPAVARSFATDKDPEGIAFLDAQWMVVANALGDTLSLVDRASGAVTSVPVDVAPDAHGLEPSGLAFGNGRLYASLAGINAVGAWDVDLSKSPPTITPAGRLPAAWWPGGVVAMPSGDVVVASLRGHGVGPTTTHFDIGDSDLADRMHGGIQRIPSPSAADLAAGEASVAADLAVSEQPGHPEVTCPGEPKDFPVPATNGEGPSQAITHVFMIVRENKDFDGLFGDMPGVEGAADLTLKPSTAEMDGIWTNLRKLARTFSMSDNYYTDAIYSTQGHVWATYGRSNDFNERTWAMSDTRSGRVLPGGGVFDVGRPVEGSLFDWLGKNGIPYDILGEADGSPTLAAGQANPIDVHYPGGPIQNIGYNDLQKACYVAGRVRVMCDTGSFVYMTLPNDHTFGVSPSNPTPEVFCAVNDEATGMVIDALSHSPIWSSSLVVITEDDPSQGGEHVDSHRAPLTIVSPWVKRGYVSKTHVDVASLHKLFAHVFGKPYPNALVAKAGLPLDLFTSTPDFTPYVYAPRTLPLACGGAATKAEARLTGSWDFDEADEQPGLDAQVTRWMRGHQLEALPVRLEAQVAAREARRAAPAAAAEP